MASRVTIKLSFSFVSMLSFGKHLKNAVMKIVMHFSVYYAAALCYNWKLHDALASQPYTSFICTVWQMFWRHWKEYAWVSRSDREEHTHTHKHKVWVKQGALLLTLFHPFPVNIIIFSLINIIITSKPIPIIA